MVNAKSSMSCNKPQKSWKPSKKRVVKACSRGKEKIIHFGASGFGNNYSDLARKSFRARHKCDKANDKLSARYWACKNLWSKGGSVTPCPKGRKCKGVASRSRRKSPKRKSPKRKSRSRRKSPKRKSRSRQKSPKRKSRSRRKSPKRKSRSRRKSRGR